MSCFDLHFKSKKGNIVEKVGAERTEAEQRENKREGFTWGCEGDDRVSLR